MRVGDQPRPNRGSARTEHVAQPSPAGAELDTRRVMHNAMHCVLSEHADETTEEGKSERSGAQTKDHLCREHILLATSFAALS
jgi:hypothetical protein